ncbi:MAG TPA: HD domain-containing protein [Candidatus Methanoperedens sp.]|nr:HD domain-containing protein [Candidatus Methanoperedens sp.]
MLSESQIFLLHRKYSHGKYKNQILDLVWTHSQIVREMSLQIANKLISKYGISINLELLTAGALIHDLGFYKCFDDNFNEIEKYIQHSHFGYELCHQEGISESLSRFCLVHNGVGIYPNIPISLEEEIVTYADCFHSKSYPYYKKISDIKKMLIKYRPEDEVIINRLQRKFGIPELSTIKEKYKFWHQKINQELKKIKSKL